MSLPPDPIPGVEPSLAEPGEPGPGSLRPALRFISFVLLLILVALAFRFTPLGELLDRQRVVAELLRLREAPWAPLALFGSYLVLAPMGLPISPLIIAGGVVFGLTLGFTVNYLGALAGAGASFLLARALGRDFVLQVTGPRLRRMETTLARHGFWSLAGIRLIPIPFPVANFGQALAGIPWPTFLLSTGVGLLPGVLVYTYLATVLFEAALGSQPRLWPVTLALLLLATLGVSPTVWKLWARRQRYQRLRRAREERAGPTGP